MKYHGALSFSPREIPRYSVPSRAKWIEAEAHLAWDALRGALRTDVSLEDSQVMYIRTLRSAVRVHGAVAQFGELVEQLQQLDELRL